MQGSAMNSMQGSAMNSMQGSAMNSMQGSAMNSMQGFKPGQGVNIVAFNPASQGVMAASLHPSGAAPYVDSLPIIDSMSAPKLVLKPEMSGGLKVSLCFRRSSLHYATTSSSASDVFQAVLSVTNCRESPIRRVRITVQSMDPNRPSIVLPEIAMIPPASSSLTGGSQATNGMFRSSHSIASAHEVAFPVDLILFHCNGEVTITLTQYLYSAL